MSVTPYQGPLVRNLSTNPVDGYLPPARGLNAYLVAQNSYAVGGQATTGTNANPVVMTQPAITQLVINTGATISARKVSATTVTLPTVASPQDVYVDVDNTGAYTPHGGAVGFTPPAVTSTSLRLYMVRTGAGGVGVAFVTPLAAVGPFNPALTSVMNVTGSNAGAVALPSSLAVAGKTTLKDLNVHGGTWNPKAGETISTWVCGASVSGGALPTATITPVAGSNSARGKVSFSISSASSLTGIVLYAYFPGINPTWGGIVSPMDAPTAGLATWMTVSGGLLIFVPSYHVIAGSTTYTFAYRTFT